MQNPVTLVWSIPSQPAENRAVLDGVDRPCPECASLNLSIEKFVIEDDKAAEMRPTKETRFLGRRFGATENKKNLIREFLRLCETNHDRRCTEKIGIEDPFFETLMEPYFGVIDIENDRLVPLPFRMDKDHLQFEPYAAVSYVWGTTRAFSGMCKLMEGTMQAPFAFGLPTSHFDLALLWEPVDLLTLLDYTWGSTEPKYKDIKFPSWSWCGWKSDGIQYKPQMVDGCLSDVRAWLSNHTWIDWHIRDGHGTLRRLWDRECNVADRSIDKKWIGYDTLVRPPEPSMVSPNTNTSESAAESSGDDSRDSKGGRNRRRLNRFNKKDLMIVRSIQQLSSRAASLEDHDQYGRPLRGGPLVPMKHGKQFEFTLTLPEDPYHVRMTASSQLAGDLKEFPDQRFLQFFTWRASFHVVRSNEANVEGDNVGKTRARCHITDRRGDKCGSIVVNKKWLKEYEKKGQTTFEFIAISDAKSFSQQEFPVWTYYLPKERVDSEWDLYFVLLVEPFPEEGIHRRVALGKVFKAAFTLSEDEWKEIILG
ncbi:hypothetical protein J4E81_007422 [Alternaria sp. BMP 2799]|nr:hypothetical protein J4E81_007422 [Alternaria sp. BMP 2799]